MTNNDLIKYKQANIMVKTGIAVSSWYHSHCKVNKSMGRFDFDSLQYLKTSVKTKARGFFKWIPFRESSPLASLELVKFFSWRYLGIWS